jgi:hypothetical protein
LRHTIPLSALFGVLGCGYFSRERGGLKNPRSFGLLPNRKVTASRRLQSAGQEKAYKRHRENWNF